ncbi:hypothetical protein CASFOL_017606 [Castilleja foliolosa]|uniref:Uncharacterized protein n=1 Tax=Castilleja foliolosa TaxID=1961234 RepID=A0ABD3D7F1_9LAMI
MKAAVGFVRVAMVYHGEDDDEYVDVRVPSVASLEIYLGYLTSSFVFPCFDQVFELSRVAAKLFLKRNLPLQLCYELRQRRGFWIDEYAEGMNNFLA